MKNPFKQNNDYEENFIDKLREKNKKLNRRIKNKNAIKNLLSNKSIDSSKLELLHDGKNLVPIAEKIGISPAFLKAALSVSEIPVDYYLPFSFTKNPKAIESARNLDFTSFVENYFGDFYLRENLDEKLKNEFYAIKKQYDNK